jgi:hypothetical protein
MCQRCALVTGYVSAPRNNALQQSRARQVPDEVTQHLLKLSGAECTDVRLCAPLCLPHLARATALLQRDRCIVANWVRRVRLVSLAAQKFVAEAAHDARQAHARRQKQPAARLKEAGYTARDKRPVLTSEDLAEALQAQGVNVQRPAYFANHAGGS